MEKGKTVFVTGATGNQGGAVTRNLLKNGFTVKALVRDPSSDKAQKLMSAGARLIKGDLDQPSSYADQLNQSDAVFALHTYLYGVDKEIRQGIALANAARERGIKHYLYSSVVGADMHTGIPHWESKFQIENHIRKLGMTYTIVRPASFFENFLFPQVRSRLVKGKLVSPVNRERIQQFVSTEDIGTIAPLIFNEPDKYAGKTYTIASQQMDMNEVATIFTEALNMPVRYQKLPGLIVRLAMGRNLHKMFKWINEHDSLFIPDFENQKTFKYLYTLQDWIPRYFK